MCLGISAIVSLLYAVNLLFCGLDAVVLLQLKIKSKKLITTKTVNEIVTVMNIGAQF